MHRLTRTWPAESQVNSIWSHLTIAAFESYSIIKNVDILPPLTRPVLAVTIIGAAFGYGFATRNKIAITTGKQSPIDNRRNRIVVMIIGVIWKNEVQYHTASIEQDIL
jgi:hypothetical protein